MKRFWFPGSLSRTGRHTSTSRLHFRPVMQPLELRDVPATFYFDPTATNSGGNGTFNSGRPDQHVGSFNPVTPVDGAVYTSLDRAVAAADTTAGRDTIRIAAGNITMTDPTLSPVPPTPPNGNTGDFGDPEGVDVIGSGVDVTVLRPNYDSSAPTAFGGVLNFFGNGSFFLSSLTINASTRNFATGVAVNDPGTSLTIANVSITNILFPSNGTQSGIGVNVKNGAELTIRDSSFSTIGTIGVSGRDPGTQLNVFSNTYTGKGAGPSQEYFVSVIDGGNAIITGNRVTNNTGVNGTFRSAAVLVGDSPEAGGTANAQIYGNSFGLLGNGAIQANDSGVIVGFDVNGISNDLSTADVRFNNLVGTRGITANVSTSAANVTAFYNFWGDPSGPTATNNPGGTGSIATAKVDIGPVRGGPITATAGASLGEIISTLNPIGPTLAVGPGTGSASNGAGTTLSLQNQAPFNATPSQSIGQRSTIGDVNGDGVNDIIVGSGPGIAGQVVVLDGKTRATLFNFPVMDGFTGGIFVAAADFNRDGVAEIVAVPDVGGGARVVIFNLSGGSAVQIQSFFVIDEVLRTGLTVALGDLNGDRVPDIVVVAGPGGGPHTVFLNGADVFTGNPPSKLFADQFLADANSRTGFFIALGDINGDGIADVIISSNTGGSTFIQIFNGQQLASGTLSTLSSFFANSGDSGQFQTGVRVAAVDLNGDARAEVIAGDGPGSSLMRVYFANTNSLQTGVADNTVDLLNINQGIYVG